MFLTLEATVNEDGEILLENLHLPPGTRVKVSVDPVDAFVWPPKGPDAEHPFWGSKYRFDRPTAPLEAEDWGTLA